MKRLAALAFLALAACAVARPHDAPEILIVQLHAPLIDSASPKNPPIDPNIPIGNMLAQSLQDDGRVQPVVWSMTDPMFRDAVGKGEINPGQQDPTLEEAQAAASREGWEYVLVIRAVTEGDQVTGQAHLYRGRGEVWSDPPPIDKDQLALLRKQLKQKHLSKEAFDKAIADQSSIHLQVLASSTNEDDVRRAEDNTAKSIAHTWSVAMTLGPLKALVPTHPQDTPAAAQGQGPQHQGPAVQLPTAPPSGGNTPPVNPANPQNPKIPDNKTLKASLKKLLDAHQTSAGIALLRDAVDVSPLDAERRLLLISLLLDSGSAEIAATTARQAAAILPDKVSFRVLAARAWLQAGRADEAQIDLNEAVAREPDSAETRLLLGQIAMAKGDLPAALDHLSAGIAKNPGDPELYFERALGEAVAGNGATSAADLAKANELGLAPEGAMTRYREAVREIDGSMKRDSASLTALLQSAELHRKDPSLRVQLEKTATITAARVAFLDALNPPSDHKKSHGQRVLALKLLVECLGNVRSYLESGDADAISDARLNLGEALNGITASRTQFEVELGEPTAHADR